MQTSPTFRSEISMVSRFRLGLRDRAQTLAHDEVILAGFSTIVDLVHQRAHQVNAESSHRAHFDGAREIRLGHREWIERPGIVLDFTGQPAVRQRQTHPDLMWDLIIVAIRYGVRD